MSEPASPIKVIIIDDQQLIIDGLISIIHSSGTIEVVGHTTDVLETRQIIQSTSPHVILMDYRFPDHDTDGVDVATQLIKDFPDINVLMLTSYDEYALIKDALSKGLKGFLLKNTDKEELVLAIKKVAAGNYYFGPNVQQQIAQSWGKEPTGETTVQKNNFQQSSSKKTDHPLTKRELEIAQLYSMGKTRKEIAEELFISSNTVDTHLKNTFGKLGLRNGVELTNYLAGNGLLK